VRPRPSDGTVKLILEHYFKLCETQKIDTYSAKCDMWFIAGKAVPEGTYRYLASWKGSVDECNKVELISNDASYTGQSSLFTYKTNKASVCSMTGLEEFKRVISEYKNLSVWAAGA
jgi:hypothetical protein